MLTAVPRRDSSPETPGLTVYICDINHKHTMDLEEVRARIKESKSIKDKSERLMALRDVAEDIANHFTESMSFLEEEIDFVLERTPQRVKDELGYESVADVTCDINPRNSWDY